MNRSDLAGRIVTVEHRMDSIERRWDASFAAFTTQILQSNRETRQEILATLRGEMEVSGGTLRGEMEVLGENLRGEMQTLGANLRGEMQTLGGELRGEMQTLGGELRGEMQTLGGGTARRDGGPGRELARRDAHAARHHGSPLREARDGSGGGRRRDPPLHEDPARRHLEPDCTAGRGLAPSWRRCVAAHIRLATETLLPRE